MKSALQWSDHYTTGIAELDDQHKMLVTMASDYATALQDGKGARTYLLFLGLLTRYARVHFDMEETLMRHYDCPVADVNRAEHDEFMKVLVDFRELYEVKGFHEADARRFIAYLENWATSHSRIDGQLKTWLERAQ